MDTLVIGYGNDSRADDGVGWLVVAELDRLGLDGAELQTAHQLDVDCADTVRDRDLVIFVDAAIPESPEAWTRTAVHPEFQSHAVTHFLTPGDVLGLCQVLYGRAPQGVLFSIRGQQFDFGMNVSPPVRAAALEVVRQIVDLVESSVQSGISRSECVHARDVHS